VLVGLTGLFVGPVLLLLDVAPATCGVWRWVEHRAWFMDCSAHCWVLRGHPVWGVSSGPWPGSSNAPLWWVWWWSARVGVWLCVECCIVDASILL
jgi:hypothetical protein